MIGRFASGHSYFSEEDAKPLGLKYKYNLDCTVSNRLFPFEKKSEQE